MYSGTQLTFVTLDFMQSCSHSSIDPALGVKLSKAKLSPDLLNVRCFIARDVSEKDVHDVEKDENVQLKEKK